MSEARQSKNNKKTLFISDLHIESHTGPVMTSLLRILETQAAGGG